MKRGWPRFPREREPEVLRLYAEHGRNASATARCLGVSPQTVQRTAKRHGIVGGPTGFGAWGVAQPDPAVLSRAARRRVQTHPMPRGRASHLTGQRGRGPSSGTTRYRCPVCLAHVPRLPHCGEAA